MLEVALRLTKHTCISLRGALAVMAIDKELWLKSFHVLYVDSLPAWPCPRCETGKLSLVSDSLVFRKNPTQYTPAAFQREDFTDNMVLNILGVMVSALEKMQWEQHKFVGFLECKDCMEAVAVSGRAEKFRQSANADRPPSTRIYLEYFSPPLPIIPLDSRYPDNVRQCVARASGYIFNDAGAAASTTRQAVELLLDSLRIPAVDSDGRRLSLHNRIVSFGKTHKDYADLLDSIRFIGNEGTHSGKVERADVLAGFEVLDHVLEEIFVRSEIRKKITESGKGLKEAYRPKPRIGPQRV